MMRGVFFSCIVTIVKYLWLFAGLYGMGLTLYWVTDRDFPTRIYDGEIIEQQIFPGDNVTAKWTMEKLRVCDGVSTRTLNGDCGSYSIYHGLPSGPVMPKGSVFIRFELPETAKPGVCFYDTRIIYRCNPIHYLYPMIQSLPTLTFKVSEIKDVKR